jgi:hypothetical protein
MFKTTPTVIALLLSLVPAAAFAQASGSQAFIKNQGQWDSRAQYLASMGGGDIWLTKQGYVLDVHQRVDKTIKGQVVRVSFSGGNSSYSDGSQLPGKMNYFIGNQPSKWTTQVPRFNGATARSMIPGLDVRYYFDQGSPRYDLMLAPGTDPSTIAMNFEGANGLDVLPSGNLQIETSLGPIEERGLMAYQLQGSTRIQVPCKMVVTGSTVHFQLGDYDKSKPLVIDPLLFCTYWYMFDYNSISVADHGDVGPQYACVDASNEVITVGSTYLKNFPTSSGAYQQSSISYFGAGYISKLSADGKQMVFGTYLSGTAINVGDGAIGDEPLAVIADASNQVYITGRAVSNDFPVSSNAFQKTKGSPTNGSANAFICALSPDGSRLVFSTYLGGTKNVTTDNYFQDEAAEIALDSKGNVVIAGEASSSDFPLTPGAFAASRDSAEGSEEFVAKVNPLGSVLIFSTLIPGAAQSAYDHESGSSFSYGGLQIDSNDNIFIGGGCNPAYFKFGTSPYNVKGGDGFLAKLSSDAKKMLFDIQLAEGVSWISLTPTGVAFVSTLSNATTWPTMYDMSGSYHIGGKGGLNTFCLGQFSSDGSTLLHSSLMGYAPPWFHTDKAGNIYFFGTSQVTYPASTTPLPTTPDAYQQTPGFCYFAEISPEQDKLLYGSYFGPFVDYQNYEPGRKTFAVAGINRFALVGSTPADGIPTTTGAYDSTIQAAFVALFSLPIYTHVELTPNPVVGGQTVSGKVTLPDSAPAGGAVITLTSSDSGVKLPATVTIPAGSLSQTFTATTTGVATSATATINAKYGVGSGTAALVRTPAALTSLSATPSSVIAGQTATATILLNGLAGPGGDLVQLSSSNPNAMVPATAVIYNGSNQAAFQIKTVVAAASYTTQIAAKLGSVTKTLQIEIDPGLTTLTVSPTSVVAGATAQGVLKLSGKVGPTGSVVSLTSSTTAASVPASVTVPSGTSLVAFNITTAGVSVAATATITAKQGSLTATGTLSIQPAVLSFFTLNPATVIGGTGLQGIVRLNGPAGPSGVSVALSSPSTFATVPAKVVIPSGASYYVFAIGTKPVTQTTTLSLKATSSSSLTAVLTINK